MMPKHADSRVHIFGLIVTFILLIGVVVGRVNSAENSLTPPLRLTVNSPLDATDANPGDKICETAAGNRVCTLRAAIMESNAWDGDDIIDVRADTYVLTLGDNNEDAAEAGDLDITDNVIIQGAGATSTIIDGNLNDRILHVIGPFDVRIAGLTFRNGKTPEGEDGGAIFNSSNGNTVIVDSIFIDNEADQWGGAIANGDSAQVELRQVLVENNRAVLGGGVDNHDGIAVIINSTIRNNEAHAKSGGGLYNDGTLRVESSLIEGNRAELDGGGIFNFDNLTLERSTVSGNSAGGDAGGLLNWGELDIRNVTVSGNSAGRDAGGIFNLDKMDMQHVTVYGNTAVGVAGGLFQDGFAILRNSLIANNGANCELYNVVDSRGINLEDANSCGLAAADLVNTAAMLGPLQNNGGFTATHAPLAGSPAIDGGSLAECATADQREVPRPQGAACDIGAHEANFDDLLITKRALNDPVLAGEQLGYVLIVRNIGQSNAANVQVEDTLPAGTTFSSVASSGWGCAHASGTVTCDKSPVALGATELITIYVTAPAQGGVITNTATVTATTPDTIASNNLATVTTTVIAQADLAITTQSLPTQIVVGQPMTFTVQVDNLGVSSAEFVTATISLPTDKLQYINATGSGWACGFNVTELVCTRPALPVGAAPPITVIVEPLVGDAIIQAPAEVESETTDPDLSNNGDIVNLGSSVLARAELALSVVDTPDPVSAAGILTYQYTVVNNGPNAADMVVLSLTPDAALTYATFSGTDWNCADVGTAIECALATLADGAVAQVSIMLTAPNMPTLLNSAATVSSAVVDPNSSNNSTNSTTSMVASADLALTIDDAPDPVAIGGNVSYTLTVRNLGPSAASNVVVSATLPSELFYSGFAGAGWSCGLNGAVVSCSRSALGAGDSAEIILTTNVVSTNAADLITVNGGVTSSTADPDLSNNQAAETTRLGVADLSVTIDDDRAWLLAGFNMNYTIAVANAGPNAATNVEVTLPLPSAVSYVGFSGNGWTCSHAAAVVTCTRATLAVDAVSAVVVEVLIGADSAEITARPTVVSDRHDPDLSNNADSEPTPAPATKYFIPIILKP